MAYYDKQKMIDIARAEVGYCEKETYDQLDEPTENAGDENYTKYQRDLAKVSFFNSSKKGVAWCAVFAAWPFYQAYGKSAALKLLCQPSSNNAGAGCSSAMNYFKDKGQFYDKPEVGDLIFFESSEAEGESSHVGIVYKTSLLNVHTVEGNTSDGKSVVENGGEVCEKKYVKSNARILGYGRPNWGDPSEAEPEDDGADTPADGEVEELPPVDAGVEIEYLCNATIQAPSGRVNFRQRPDKTGKLVKGMNKVKNGETVKVKTTDGVWAAVEYGKYYGYIMCEFLIMDKEVKVEHDPDYVYYVTVQGDTLWGIAKKFLDKGQRFKEIKELNGLKSNICKPGMRLKIPNEGDG